MTTKPAVPAKAPVLASSGADGTAVQKPMLARRAYVAALSGGK